MNEPRNADVSSALDASSSADVSSACGDLRSADVSSACDLPRISADDKASPAEADETSAIPSVKGWHYRGYLPHFDDQDTPQFITFRLADSVPREVLEVWQRELGLSEQSERPHSPATANALRKLRTRVEKYLDCGHGSCLLRQTKLAGLVQDALHYFNGERYQLHAWVIMPNHVHVLCRQHCGHNLGNIIQSWKSFTAHAINRAIGGTGTVWQADYFDRYIRDEDHFLRVFHYIETNPVTAGLCQTPEDWLWNSASRSADVSSAFDAIRSADVSSAVLHYPVVEPAPESPEAGTQIGIEFS